MFVAMLLIILETMPKILKHVKYTMIKSNYKDLSIFDHMRLIIVLVQTIRHYWIFLITI